MSTLEDIYASVLKFLIPLSTEETFETIAYEAMALVNGKNASILLEDKGALKRVYATSPLSFRIKTRSKGYRYEAFKKAKAQVIHASVVEKLKKVHPEIGEFGGKSIILIPLTNQGKPFGLLTVISSKDRMFTKKDLDVLKLFGSLASLAIRKSELYEKLKDSLETRDLFISLAAHELRTPLTTINGYVQLLLSKLAKKKPIHGEWIMELGLESQRLKNLIDEFLEINRIRTGKLQYNWQECKIREITRRVVANFKINNPDRKLIFKDKLGSINDIIIGDKDKLIQVFNNVLENAEKYSPDNRKISFTIKYDFPYFILDVTDQGQGIKQKDLPQVFKGFYKGENSLHEGMGLGLFLSKKIIESHHGEISLRSQINKGTKVRVKLPKA